MADVITSIRLGNRDWRVQGDDQDTSFTIAQAQADGLAPLLAAVRQRVADNATILDLGANVGLATLALSELVPAGRVIAFEPGPATVRHLTANVAMNGVDNCTIVPMAVGGRPGTIPFAAGPGFSAGAHVVHAAHAAKPTKPGATIDVPVVTVDAWLASAGVERVDFIKLDVEGYEPWVLDGARATIERDRPAIFMEFNAWCLLFMGGVNPVTLAKGLWPSFRVTIPDASGDGLEPATAIRFAHDNLVRHGAVQDVILELRDGERVPPLHDLIGSLATEDAAASIA